MITIQALGGSGEDSRNCFLVSCDDCSFLLDCGVKREIAPINEVYPLLTKEIAISLDAVFLSHCHEDHTAALPYLHNLGYRGPVYGSRETIELTGAFLKKWRDYVADNNGQLPFRDEDIDHIDFQELTEASPFLLDRGRSGHVLGGIWMRFEVEGQRILYTGDISYDSLLLAADPLPQADILIVDSAYAGKRLIQKQQYRMLSDSIRKTIETGGSVLLPVPANGRGIDMYEYLKQEELIILLDKAIKDNELKLRKRTDWIKETDLWNLQHAQTRIIGSDLENQHLNQPAVILVADGMLTSSKSRFFFDRLKSSPLNKCIISGHSARGTLAGSIQDQRYCAENGIRLDVELITVKVHPDSSDVIEMVDCVRPHSVVLFHSKESSCEGLKQRLQKQGKKVLADIRGQLTAGG